MPKTDSFEASNPEEIFPDDFPLDDGISDEELDALVDSEIGAFEA